MLSFQDLMHLVDRVPLIRRQRKSNEEDPSFHSKSNTLIITRDMNFQSVSGSKLCNLKKPFKVWNPFSYWIM